MDGNKRTALMVYLILSFLNDVESIRNNEDLVRVFVALAASRGDVAAAARLLFPGCHK